MLSLFQRQCMVWRLHYIDNFHWNFDRERWGWLSRLNIVVSIGNCRTDWSYLREERICIHSPPLSLLYNDVISGCATESSASIPLQIKDEALLNKVLTSSTYFLDKIMSFIVLVDTLRSSVGNFEVTGFFFVSVQGSGFVWAADTTVIRPFIWKTQCNMADHFMSCLERIIIPFDFRRSLSISSLFGPRHIYIKDKRGMPCWKSLWCKNMYPLRNIFIK